MFGFCDECRGMVKYEIETRDGISEVKGEEVKYTEKIAVCNECGTNIYVGDMMDENLDEIDRMYRRDRELITIEEIKTILEKYNIGKKPLSNLLGWGEVTVTRYVDGQIPSKQYSNELYDILANPPYVRETLEKNKDNISDVGYRKVDIRLREMECISSMDLEGISKIEVMSKYIVSLLGDITSLALQKLLYYIQGFYVAFLGEYIFEENCEAWAHGPVYKRIYNKYKDYVYEPIDKCEVDLDIYEEVLSLDEIEVANVVVRNFGRYSGKVLENMTHNEKPWRDARGNLGNADRSNEIIDRSNIKEYFEDVVKSYDMLNIVDIRDYTVDIINKITE